MNMKYFSDYKTDAHNWITMSSGEFYPDILSDACELYKTGIASVRPTDKTIGKRTGIDAFHIRSQTTVDAYTTLPCFQKIR